MFIFCWQHNLDIVYTLPETTKIGGNESALPLREIVRRLEKVYCSSIGVEYMHIDDPQKCTFFKKQGNKSERGIEKWGGQKGKEKSNGYVE